MVNNVTSLTGNGLKDWLVQRISGLYFASYILFVFFYVIYHHPLDYFVWVELFDTIWFQLASVIALVSLTLHAWIGLWTVSTDYVKGTGLRLTLQMGMVLWLSALFVWGLMIIWGI